MVDNKTSISGNGENKEDVPPTWYASFRKDNTFVQFTRQEDIRTVVTYLRLCSNSILLGLSFLELPTVCMYVCVGMYVLHAVCTRCLWAYDMLFVTWCRVLFLLCFAHLSPSSFSPSRTFCTQFYVQFYLVRDSTWLYLVREREVLELIAGHGDTTQNSLNSKIILPSLLAGIGFSVLFCVTCYLKIYNVKNYFKVEIPQIIFLN